MRGALAWLSGDSTAWHGAVAAANRLDARPADFWAEVAEAAARHRRYAEAVELARRGVALDSGSVAALTALGNNLLRIGEIPAGRAALDRAFALDPFHLWNKNTLDLLDELAGFTVVTLGRFTIVAPPSDVDLLTTVLPPLLEEAYDTLVSRYDYRPPTPIRVELYDRHADFSVRTIGLTGLGALGVSFGPVLVLDAPEARAAGEFNLGLDGVARTGTYLHPRTLGIPRPALGVGGAVGARGAPRPAGVGGRGVARLCPGACGG